MYFMKTPNIYVVTFLKSKIVIFSIQNTIKLGLQKCHGMVFVKDKLNLSEIWLCFVVLNEPGIIIATTQTTFKFFWKMCKNCAHYLRKNHLQKSMKSSILTVDCVSDNKNEWHHVPWRKNFAFIFICSEVTAQTRCEECQFYCDP